MTRILTASLAILPALLILLGCGKSEKAGGSDVTLRDREVVDGTANDAMVDLDNATDDGTPLLDNSALGNAVEAKPAKKVKPASDATATPADEKSESRDTAPAE